MPPIPLLDLILIVLLGMSLFAGVMLIVFHLTETGVLSEDFTRKH